MSRLRSIWLVARREIIERGRSRAYVLSLVVTIVLIGAGFLLPSLVAGGPETLKIGLIADTPPAVEQAIRTVSTAVDADKRVEFSRLPDRAAAEAALADESIGVALSVPADLSSAGEIIVQESLGGEDHAVISQAIIGLRAGAALIPPTLTELEPRSAEDRTAFLFANAGIILMFVGIFTYGYWVLGGVVEEKQSRVVEVVLSTVRARDLLIGKVLGIGVLGLGQLIVIVAVGLIGTQLTGQFVLPSTTFGAVAMLLLWFVLGYALYSTALGFLGALASRMEEASNATTPVTMVAVFSYLAAILLVTEDPSSLLARVLTLLPPSAPMVVPLRAALGAIEPWEIILSIVITAAAIWGLFVIGGRVYSGAVLQTGGRMKVRDAWRASR
jgi:ABC-2 type transport system permease protein